VIAVSLNLLDDIKTFHNCAKDDVLAIQVWGLASANEELTSVGVGAGIGHGEAAGSSVLAGFACEALISEFGAIDGLATGSVASREVTTLAHESWDHTMELGALEAKALLAGAQSAEVLGRLGDGVIVELECDPSDICATNGHLEEDLLRHVEHEEAASVKD